MPAHDSLKLPESSYIFLGKLYSLGRATTYEVYRSVTAEGRNLPEAVTLPLQTAYRIARQLQDKGLVEDAGTDELNNGLTKQYYRITTQGIRTLRKEAERLFTLTMSVLTNPHDITEEEGNE